MGRCAAIWSRSKTSPDGGTRAHGGLNRGRAAGPSGKRTIDLWACEAGALGVASTAPHFPTDPPAARIAVLWIANLGGFIGRRRDGGPGVRGLCRGFRRLQDITAMWSSMSQDIFATLLVRPASPCSARPPYLRLALTRGVN